MKIQAETITKVILELAEEEAVWLKGLVQNPIGVEYEDEEESDRKMRQIFWDTLSKVLLIT